jgi:hypothetical protein
MTAKAVFELECDPRNLVAAITKLEEKVASLESKNRQLRETSTRGSEEAAKGLDVTGKSAAGLAKNVLAAGAAFLTFDKVLGVLTAIDQRMDAIAKRSDDVGKASRDAAAQLPPEVSKAIRRQAADMGVSPTESISVAGTMAAIYGEEGAKKAMPAVNRLIKMGVAGGDISEIAAAGEVGGLDFSATAGAFGRAAVDSKLTPAQLSQAAPAWGEYKDPRTGMAVSAALSKAGVAPGSLMDRTRDLSMALNMDSDLMKKAWEKAGGTEQYSALDEVQRVAVMKSIIPDLDKSGTLSTHEVMKAGITEQQKADAIARASNKLDFLKQEQVAVLQASPETLQAIIGQQEKDPTVRGANRSAASEAMAEYTASDTLAGQKARLDKDIKRQFGRELMQKGYSWGWDSQTGEATLWGSLLQDPTGNRALSMRTKAYYERRAEAQEDAGATAGAEPARAGGGGGFVEAIGELIKELRANTDATRQNSNSTPAHSPSASGPNRNAGV